MPLNTDPKSCWYAISYGTRTGTGAWKASRNPLDVQNWLRLRKQGNNKQGLFFQGLAPLEQLLKDHRTAAPLVFQAKNLSQYVKRFRG